MDWGHEIHKPFPKNLVGPQPKATIERLLSSPLASPLASPTWSPRGSTQSSPTLSPSVSAPVLPPDAANFQLGGDEEKCWVANFFEMPGKKHSLQDSRSLKVSRWVMYCWTAMRKKHSLFSGGNAGKAWRTNFKYTIVLYCLHRWLGF